MSLKTAPFYLVCDVSHSMQGEPIAAVNSALTMVRDLAIKDPSLQEVVRFSIIDFAGSAANPITPTQLNSEISMPTLRARDGGTVYSAAFKQLWSCLPSDVEEAKQEAAADADGGAPHVIRPIVFFLSDGLPTDGDETWRSALAALKDESFRQRPNIFAFGISDANAATIAEVATHKEWAWMQDRGTPIKDAILGFFSQMLVTMTRTSEAGVESVVPETPDGMVPALDFNDLM